MNKEIIVKQALIALRRNRNIDLKIIEMSQDSIYFNVQLEYTKNGNQAHLQNFGFTGVWFKVDYFNLPYVRDLSLPDNLSDEQKLILKFAYYFYMWYKMDAE